MITASADALGVLTKGIDCCSWNGKGEKFSMRPDGEDTENNNSRNLKEMFESSNNFESLLAGPQYVPFQAVYFRRFIKL